MSTHFIWFYSRSGFRFSTVIRIIYLRREDFLWIWSIKNESSRISLSVNEFLFRCVLTHWMWKQQRFFTVQKGSRIDKIHIFIWESSQLFRRETFIYIYLKWNSSSRSRKTDQNIEWNGPYDNRMSINKQREILSLFKHLIKRRKNIFKWEIWSSTIMETIKMKMHNKRETHITLAMDFDHHRIE